MGRGEQGEGRIGTDTNHDMCSGASAAAAFRRLRLGLDGTVYLGEELLPGVRETIENIREGGARVVFVTNNPLEVAAGYAAKLTHLGIPTTADAVVTTLDSLRPYLTERHEDSRLLVVGEELVRSTLAGWGSTVVDDPAEAEVVIVSSDRSFDYAKLKVAFCAVVQHGASIVATNPDPYCPTPNGGLPDSGAMLAAIEACTGETAEAVLGKPSAAMGRALLDRLGTPPGDSALVGDRLLTDIAMGQAVGMPSVLVLSGATSAGAVIDSKDLHPDYVVESLRELLPVLSACPQTG